MRILAKGTYRFVGSGITLVLLGIFVCVFPLIMGAAQNEEMPIVVIAIFSSLGAISAIGGIIFLVNLFVSKKVISYNEETKEFIIKGRKAYDFGTLTVPVSDVDEVTYREMTPEERKELKSNAGFFFGAVGAAVQNTANAVKTQGRHYGLTMTIKGKPTYFSTIVNPREAYEEIQKILQSEKKSDKAE